MTFTEFVERITGKQPYIPFTKEHETFSEGDKQVDLYLLEERVSKDTGKGYLLTDIPEEVVVEALGKADYKPLEELEELLSQRLEFNGPKSKPCVHSRYFCSFGEGDLGLAVYHSVNQLEEPSERDRAVPLPTQPSENQRKHLAQIKLLLPRDSQSNHKFLQTVYGLLVEHYQA